MTTNGEINRSDAWLILDSLYPQYGINHDLYLAARSRGITQRFYTEWLRERLVGLSNLRGGDPDQ